MQKKVSFSSTRRAFQRAIPSRSCAPWNTAVTRIRDRALRAKPSNALSRFGVGQQVPVGVCSTAANFSYLCLGQVRVMHMLDIVEQRAGGGILLTFRQLLDLTHGLLK